MLQRKQQLKSHSKQPCTRIKKRKGSSPTQLHKLKPREVHYQRRPGHHGNENSSSYLQDSNTGIDNHKTLLSEAAKMQISCISKVRNDVSIENISGSEHSEQPVCQGEQILQRKEIVRRLSKECEPTLQGKRGGR
eukprot:TRINITY_DN7101_c0_g5_i7.p1 TRINITY_DN7101_c0_g5~~TRINITY_DN7101_c0_g5_i7.p1  ORF type:complete len:135 (+),score=8.17 TRINITY_DN7101_c0_g5_i7:165-569(+)